MATKKDDPHKEAQSFISNDEFNELLRDSIKMDQEYFDSGEQTGFIPQLKIIGLKGDDGKRVATLIVLTDLTDDNKYDLMMSIGVKFALEGQHAPVCALFTTEAWVRTYTPEEQRGENFKQPSAYPDKQEALITSGLTIDGRANMATTKINRLKGNVISLGTSHILEYDPKERQGVDPQILRKFFLGYMLAMKKRLEGEKNGKKESN